MSYFMNYRCWNCGVQFQRTLDDGTVALGRGGVCPVCKIEDGKQFGNGEFFRTENHIPVGAIDVRTIGER
jgi:DNA-directed RNA polymerase subunit RPC12/RpoP